MYKKAALEGKTYVTAYNDFSKVESGMTDFGIVPEQEVIYLLCERVEYMRRLEGGADRLKSQKMVQFCLPESIRTGVLYVGLKGKQIIYSDDFHAAMYQKIRDAGEP